VTRRGPCGLRHTNLKGDWRDALDGLITIPVNVKPKPVKLETDALKNFDDVLIERARMAETTAIPADTTIRFAKREDFSRFGATESFSSPLTRWNEGVQGVPALRYGVLG